MNKTFLKHIPVMVILTSLITIFLVGTFFDKQFSELFVRDGYEKNFFGVFVDIFGVPIFTIPLMVIVTVLYNWFLFSKIKPKTRDRIQRWKLITFWLIVFIALTLMTSIPVMRSHNPNYYLLIWVFSTLIYWTLFGYIFWFFNKKDQRQKFINQEYNLQTLLVMVIFCVGVYFTVFILKIIFNRPRPDATLLPNAVKEYQAWWNISYQNFSLKNESFPSGHVGIAMSLLSILFLFKNKNWKWWTLTTIISLVILLIAFGRIIFLKHFITDVTMSMILGVLFYAGAARMLKKNWLKKWEVTKHG
ncbi:phosphatase PAP2 family protein [Williamsoniiplasma luminosum]|uniref:Phosphatidic acid phosphatase type 2/haloperoxidase domain-containing protein n=1 Tax=Williamsoniiplasma luminosum TaxID=214888 RepID=A0A2S0NK27_9MOLU|nr:phosphatase PAP2 family protein [Williamsoniiplasma luminosum]AVP49364.1 MAG: hypothetical protein C5T88_02080 [Williamsoniiplasma luminosum]